MEPMEMLPMVWLARIAPQLSSVPEPGVPELKTPADLGRAERIRLDVAGIGERGRAGVIAAGKIVSDR